MKKAITFDDVLIVQGFSSIKSRKDVSLFGAMGNQILSLPIISANMDTVTGPEMAKAMHKAGGIACLHRFCTIDENVQAFLDSKPARPMVSIGLGEKEFARAQALKEVGATHFVVDVSHGAQMGVVEQVVALRSAFGENAYIVAGNFSSSKSVSSFLTEVSRMGGYINALKIGVGPGAMCTTREVTGVGMPQLSAILEAVEAVKNHETTYCWPVNSNGKAMRIQIIADGGLRTSGDIAKALGAGAHMVMIGSMLAATDETPGKFESSALDPVGKWYRGSASLESYKDQGKIADHRSPEGAATYLKRKGPVAPILQQIEGGIRSAMTFVGAEHLEDFRNNCEFVETSHSTVQENKAHGVK